jgi:hypothetical protein
MTDLERELFKRLELMDEVVESAERLADKRVKAEVVNYPCAVNTKRLAKMFVKEFSVFLEKNPESAAHKNAALMGAYQALGESVDDDLPV